MIIITRLATDKDHFPATQFFCSQESLDANEPLAGTAPRADVWFLLEYPGRWGNKALKESSIPDAVKAHLNAGTDAIPEARLLLVKQARRERAGIAFIAAIANAATPVSYRFELQNYEDLLELDLAAIAAQDERYADKRNDGPVFVVCTNGLRDQCCALHGVATYWALAERFPGQVWESTHHGGHRFAANMLHLPHGLSYGRLRPDNAAAVVQAGLAGEISLAQARGRSTLGEAAQAAELLLRLQTGAAGVNGLRYEGSDDLGEGKTLARFGDGKQSYAVTVAREEGSAHTHISCGDEKPAPVVTYRLVELKTA